MATHTSTVTPAGRTGSLPWDEARRTAHAAGSAMLRGLARAAGFAVIPPGGTGSPGDVVALVPLPLLPEERP